MLVSKILNQIRSLNSQVNYPRLMTFSRTEYLKSYLTTTINCKVGSTLTEILNVALDAV